MIGLQLLNSCVYNFSYGGRAVQQAINQKSICDTVNLIAYLESKLILLPDQFKINWFCSLLHLKRKTIQIIFTNNGRAL